MIVVPSLQSLTLPLFRQGRTVIASQNRIASD